MQKTSFRIEKMDCPSEEQLIRMKFDGDPEINALDFDISARTLIVYHTGAPDDVFRKLDELRLDTTMQGSVSADDHTLGDSQQRKVLWIVLLINFALFGLEIVYGFISNSMGLIADSLDMLADSLVYGLALFAVGGSILLKKTVTRISGIFQMVLALIGLAEVIRRFIAGTTLPDFTQMIYISLIALLGNAVCLFLLRKRKSDEVHIQASVIFTSNDVVVNLGVIAAALLVYFFSSVYPDLIIGIIVFFIVARGALRILRLSR